jgi:four helix bundle protein
MGTAKTFQDLEVWQKAHHFVLQVYETSKHFPKEEMFGLTSQTRRAAVSIPANIAEGFKQHGAKDKIRFYNIAQSSLEEVRYYLILIKDLGFTNIEAHEQLVEEISKMLASCIRKINSD